MTKGEITKLQNELNAFIKAHRGLGHTRLHVDGGFGVRTQRMLRSIKYDLGYKRENINLEVNDKFYHRLRNPTMVRPEWGQTKEAVKRGKQRRRRRQINVRANHLRGFMKPGVGRFDGKPVAKAAIPVLTWCRQHGWHGVLVSGFRTPAFSESLCLRMCGRPTCPGRCAGRKTNHAFAVPSRFGIDVSDFATFRTVVAKCPLQPHIHNSLPNDPVHFSPSGN